MSVTLEAGNRAPSFTMRDQDGVERRLEDYKGQTVVQYFYPKDETPGCTTQACSLRDYWSEIQAEGATVAGDALLVPARKQIQITYAWPESHPANHAPLAQ